MKSIITTMGIAMLLFSFTSEKTEKVKGFDPANLDTTIQPGSDFYHYANGGWLKTHPMPAEYSRYGSFDKLQEDNDKMVHDLIETLTLQKHYEGSLAQKVTDFYLSGMDSVTIEKEGVTPLNPEFEKINKAASIKDIQQLIAYFHCFNISPLFNFIGEPDSKNSEMIITSLTQGGLGLGDRDYYVAADEHSQEIRREYVKHIEKMLSFAGFEKNAALEASQIMQFETRLATASKSRLELRDPETNYNKIKLDAVKALAPDFDWDNYFKSVGLPVPGEINVGQPLFFQEFNKMIRETPLKEWKAYLTWTLINETATFLSSNFVNQNFEFFDKFMSGRKIIRPRWRRVLNATNLSLGEALGQMYVEKYFPPSAKERMLKLVENLRISLGERLNTLTWMGDSTKQKAQEKLSSIRVKIGYPDKWRDYSDLSIKKEAYVKNVLKGRKFNFEFELSKINKPVDHSRWYMTPQTVNAYYNPFDNEICFPAGILQPPFFFADADDAVNYGAIGVVIGHEITHGFDDQGRKYDKKGNLNDWWTNEDAKHFAEHTEVLVNRFSSFSVLDGVKADGKLTLGENIADLGGLKISFAALQKGLKQNPVPEKIDGFTPQQRYFLAYAHVWGQHITDKEIARRTKEDVHSIGQLRVLGPLPNLQEFYDAFGVKPGDKMYIPEDQRAIIW